MKILIIGVAYKPNINDFRESPALDIIELLEKSGSRVDYYDPYIDFLKFNNVKLIYLDKLRSAQIFVKNSYLVTKYPTPQN